MVIFETGLPVPGNPTLAPETSVTIPDTQRIHSTDRHRLARGAAGSPAILPHTRPERRMGRSSTTFRRAVPGGHSTPEMCGVRLPFLLDHQGPTAEPSQSGSRKKRRPSRGCIPLPPNEIFRGPEGRGIPRRPWRRLGFRISSTDPPLGNGPIGRRGDRLVPP